MIMKIEDIRRILIVGAGTMGQEIGLQCARFGYEVVLYDLDPAQLDRATARQRAVLARLVAEGHLTPAEAETTLERITISTDPGAAASQVDLLSESAPENPELKAEVLAQFNVLCPAHTIFTTNTSTLIPSMFAAATGRPDRFAAFHFHHEVWVSNVVDIMPHPGTAEEVVELLYALARRIGQIPLICHKEHHGYLLNAMLNAVNTTAVSIVVNEIASFEDVDRAWIGVMKMPVGPFGILDGVGLDTAWDITAYWAKVLNDPQLQKNAAFLKQYVDRGYLGVKSGQGFYTYPDPLYQQPNFLIG
jgi:3-hydroxybutyryl-CoA dehydrogenase